MSDPQAAPASPVDIENLRSGRRRESEGVGRDVLDQEHCIADEPGGLAA
jgi:hypothetical protein